MLGKRERMGKRDQRNETGLARQDGFEVRNPQVAGIDVGSRAMHVCAADAGGQLEVREFATTTKGIRACAGWFKQGKVKSAAVESTGVYWIPVMEVLEEEGIEVLLVDTRPMSRVPGRKTDVQDSQWIQKLPSCGLLQGCFRPAEAVVELRSLVRQKAVLVSEQADWVRRMQKCLDQMNVRVHHAVSDAQGVTGMAIIRAIVAGERDPVRLAALRDRNCQKSKEQIAALLEGHWREDHLFNLAEGLKMYDAMGERISAYEREIEKRMRQQTPAEREQEMAPPLPNRAKLKAIKRRGEEERRQALYRMVGVDLTTIDSVGVETAEAVVSEYGTDLSRFASEKQFIAHLQLAPRRSVSGGKKLKKRRGKTKGTRAGQALRTAAVNSQRTKTALGAYYRRIARTKDGSVAVFSTARKLAALIYRLLRWGQAYVDEGQKAYEERYQKLRIRTLASTAAQLGYELVRREVPVNP